MTTAQEISLAARVSFIVANRILSDQERVERTRARLMRSIQYRIDAQLRIIGDMLYELGGGEQLVQMTLDGEKFEGEQCIRRYTGCVHGSGRECDRWKYRERANMDRLKLFYDDLEEIIEYLKSTSKWKDDDGIDVLPVSATDVRRLQEYLYFFADAMRMLNYAVHLDISNL